MKAARIFRTLRNLGVPLERAHDAARNYSEETQPPTLASAAQKMLRREAHRLNVQTFRRQYRVWCRTNGLPLPVFEHQFAIAKLQRGWRLDIAWPDVHGPGGVYLENDGGAWVGGRHTRPAGFIEDQAKRNAAVSLGWRPLHCTPQTLYSDAVLQQLRTLLRSPDAAVVTETSPRLPPLGLASETFVPNQGN